MEGRCESNRGSNEVYPATFSDEGKTALKLDDDDDENKNTKTLCVSVVL